MIRHNYLQTKRRGRANQTRLRLEPLEDRNLLTVSVPVSVSTSNEGSAAALTATLPTAILNDLEAEIVWGDGFTDTVSVLAGATAINKNHTYADNPSSSSYAVSLSYEDGSVAYEGETTASVSNVAPALSNLVATSISENGVTTLTGTITDPGNADTFTLVINWGDPRSPGNSQTETFSASSTGSQTFSFTHHYLDNPSGSPAGSYTIGLDVTDKDSGTSHSSTTVAVSNITPTWSLLALTTSLEGTPSSVPAVLSGTIADAGSLDGHAVSVNWGDGSSATTFTISAGTLSFSGVTHSYADNRVPGSGQPGSPSSGTYSVSVTVTDTDGANSTSSVTAHVNNVPPSLSNLAVVPFSSSESSIHEASAAKLTGTISDVSSQDSFVMKVNWGEGSLIPQTQYFGAGTTDFYVAHTFADNGSFTVTVNLRDDDMLSPEINAVTATVTASVGNVAPTLSDLSASTINENGTTTLTGYIDDPGTKDTFLLSVNWGDSRSPNNVQENIPYPVNATGRQAFTLTHQYLDNPVGGSGNQYTIGLDIKDKDNATNHHTTQVAVNNVGPSTVSVAFSSSTINGYGTATLNGSFLDPGTLDTHTVSINWGDGSTPTTLSTLSAGVLSFSSSHQYPNNNPTQTYTAIATVTDTQGASASDSEDVNVTYVAPTVSDLEVTDTTQWTSWSGTNTIAATPATITGTLSHFDPAQGVSVHINWGDADYNADYFYDGSNPTEVNVAATANTDGTFSFTATHTYGLGGTFDVTVEATQGSRIASSSTTATVEYVAPDIYELGSGVGITSYDVGPPPEYTVVAGVSIVNPSSMNWYTVVFDWGDGTTSTTGSHAQIGKDGPNSLFIGTTKVYPVDPTNYVVSATVTIQIGADEGSPGTPGPSTSTELTWLL